MLKYLTLAHIFIKIWSPKAILDGEMAWGVWFILILTILKIQIYISIQTQKEETETVQLKYKTYN